MNKKLEIYTDGSCLNNPGKGGWAMIVMDEFHIVDIEHDFDEYTTNNRMELQAILHALIYASEHPEKSFIIYSDSAYCVNMCNQWIHTWARNGWKNSKNKEVENLYLVKEIYELLVPSNDEWSIQNFQIVKVDGHAGIVGNELADAIATGSRKKYEGLLVEYNLIENDVFGILLFDKRRKI